MAAENEAAKQARAAELAGAEQELAAKQAERDAHIDALKAELDSSVNALSMAYKQGQAEAAANSSAEQSTTAEVAENTATIASGLEGTKEDLKYMRDIAEQEAINRFTTAEVKIDMTGMTNRIDSSMDLDGVLSKLTDGFAEALAITAEGVHS